jgi:predicted RNase H-like nuclease (RuvC/YqgF family)
MEPLDEERVEDRSKRKEEGEADRATIAAKEATIADYERMIKAKEATIADYGRMIEAERAKVAETRDAAAIEDCRAAIEDSRASIKDCRASIKRCYAAIKRCDAEIKALQTLRDLEIAERKMAALTLGLPGATTFSQSRWSHACSLRTSSTHFGTFSGKAF